MEDEKNKDLTTKNTLGSAGFILALAGFTFALIEFFTGWFPLLEWTALILGVVFSIIGTFKNPKNRAISGMGVSAVTVILLIFNGASNNFSFKPPIDFKAILASYPSINNLETKVQRERRNLKQTRILKTGIIENEQTKIQITSHEIIPIGEKGNESGDKPIIVFWFEVTNKSDEITSALKSWAGQIVVYQDTRSDLINTLNTTILNDAQFLDSSSRVLEDIKKGDTVKCAIAYELDDDEIPVDLVDRDIVSGEFYGKIRYQINKD
ncbi:DUF5067 domain-containing protein [Listeria monocytogenes]|nr:DUF5067 domain-containing protein [Listeria monocytogenes]EAF5966828.1 DUF5067 domain-containing protein [Listeria monocytogenes]EHR7111009.1 DUF5067 domain-containing protein [Listeria monocytogenes]MCV43443.1 DUF5067 domain-containing protein [Listeria monocytogenes]